MLRQKRIVYSSWYYYKKSLTSVRSFHLTYSSLLRRLPSSSKRAPEIEPVPEEPNVAGSFVAQPLKSTFNNFYGIESDEGVVHITNYSTSSKPSHNTFINKFSSKNLPEKLKRTSFGKVRLDMENKVIFHGQFEESISTLDEIKLTRNIKKRNVAIEKSDTSYSSLIKEPQVPQKNIQDPVKSNLDDVIHQTETQAKLSEMDDNKIQNHEEIKDVNFIDELYFPDKLLHDQDTNKVQIKNSSSDSKETNFIEGYYFGNEVNKIEKSVKATNNNVELNNEAHINSSSFKISEQKLSSDIYESPLKLKQSKESMHFIPQMNFNPKVKEIDCKTKKDSFREEVNGSFIDECFFKNKVERNSIENSSEHFVETFSSPQIKKGSSFSEEENISFIDECFFKNTVESNSVEKSPEHFVETVSSPNTLTSQDYTIDHKRHQIYNQINPNDDLNTKLNAQSTEFIEDFKPNRTTNTKILNPSKLNDYAEDTTIHSSLKNPTKFAYKDALKKSLNSVKTQERTQAKSLSKDHQNIKRVVGESKQKVEKLFVRGDEKEQNGDKNQQDQPETAFDFVKKLRGDQKASTYHESMSGFETAPAEKFDSKGFRILKYQVPKLKYCTRDEMLELLVKNVLYSDDDVVVLNKPYNLVMHESKTTNDACLSKYLDDFAGLLDKTAKNPKLLTVHRLDKETTGCLLLARNEVSAQRLKSLFAQRKITKTYWIVTIRVPDPLQGIIDIPISEGFIEKKARMVLHPNLPKDIAYRNHSKRGKNAVTHYNVVSQCGNAALVEVKPETGIKHQIRVHFGLGLGCPILGDHKYSYPDKFVPQKLSSDMLNRLHVQQSKVRHIPMHIYARSVFIPQYTTGRNLFVVAPMPTHMSKNLQRLKFKKN